MTTFGTRSDSDRPVTKVGIYETTGPVAVAPGSKVVAVVFTLLSTYCFLQEALQLVVMELKTLMAETDKLKHIGQRTDKLKHIGHPPL